MAGRTPTQKVSDWFAVYDAVRAELTPPAYQEMVDAMMLAKDPNNPTAPLRAAIDIARMVAANNRTAATVAGILTSAGMAASRLEVLPDPEEDSDDA
jgi:hypothetical protein